MDTETYRYIQDVIAKYAIKRATERELSLFALSAVAESYVLLLPKYLGFSYEAVGAIGEKGKWRTILNEERVVNEMSLFVDPHYDELQEEVFGPALKVFEKVKDVMKEAENILEDKPLETLNTLCQEMPRFMLSLGIYNCFWRYIGNEHKKGKLTERDIEKVGRERDIVAEFYHHSEKIFIKTLDTLAIKNRNTDWRLLSCATLNEVSGVLETEKISDSFVEELKKRQSGYFYLLVRKDKRELVVSDPALIQKIRSKYFEAITEQINLFRGFSAYPGVVRGNVFNLMMKSGSSPQKPYIFVAGMTKPQDMIYIKDAEAMITDEGGILCHAAIIARELKKPCIIGTKIATQVLKDGDLVEVDADKGIVRILPN